MSASKIAESVDQGREMYLHTSADYGNIIQALKQLPNIHNIRINFGSPDEELAMIEELPSLEYLNDTKVVKQSFNMGKNSNRSNSRLKAKGLQSKAKLAELTRNAEMIGSDMHKMSKLEASNPHSLGYNKEVIVYKKLFAYVKDFLNEGNTRTVDRSEFHGFLKNIEIDYQDSLKNSSYDFVKNTLLTMAQFSLHNFCYVRAQDIQKEVDSGIHSTFKILHENLNNYIREYFQNILGLESYVNNLKKDSVQKKNDAVQRTQEVLQKAEILVKENEQTLSLYETDKKEWENLKKSQYAEVKILEKENKQLLEKLVKHGKDKVDDLQVSKFGGLSTKSELHQSRLMSSVNVNASVNLNKNTKSHLEKSALLQSIKNEEITSTQGPKYLSLHQMKEVIKEIYDSKAKHDEKCQKFKNPLETMEQHLDTYFTTKFGLKSLVVEWIQTLLHGIKTYSSEDHDVLLFAKILHNDIDEDFRLVQEEVKTTLRQCLKLEVRKSANKVYNVGDTPKEYDLYYEKGATYNQMAKSGSLRESKKFTSNWHKGNFGTNSSTKNSNTKKHGSEKLQVFASEAKVKKLYEENLTGAVDIEQCYNILNSVIKKEDIGVIEDILMSEATGNPKQVQYTLFEKVVQDFFLSQHENFLAKTRQIFKSLDVDDDGLLSPNELANTIGYIDPMNELKLDRDEFISLCDPFATGFITFTKFIQVLSQIRVTVDQRQTNEVCRSFTPVHRGEHETKEMSVIQFTQQ